MAKEWWEDAPLARQEPEEKKKEQAWWEAAPLASAPKAPAKPEPTESGGFTGSFVESLKERFGTALPTAKLFTGLGDRKQATEELLKAREESQNAYKQTEFSDIGDAFKQGNFGEALGKTVDKFKEVAGSSFGSMAPAAAAGYGAGVVGGPLVGMAAFGIVSLGSYIADNIGRQKEEQKKLGREAEDINRLTATTAAAGQTALDIFGFKFFKPLGQLVGIEGKVAAEKAAMEIVEAATRPNAYAKAVARGTAAGIAFEVPQEVTQQVLERWQAGLPLNPFTDPEAAKEYAEAAGGALLLGGPMGAVSSAAQTRKARQSPEGQALLKEATEGSFYDIGSRKEPYYDPGFGSEAGGVGAGMAGQPGAMPPTPGAGEFDADGMVLSGRPPSAPDQGAGQQQDTLKNLIDEFAEQRMPYWAARSQVTPQTPKYGVPDVGIPSGEPPEFVPTETQGAPAAPNVAERLSDFERQYQDLRAEALNLMGQGTTTQSMMNQLKLVQRDLSAVVDANADLIGNRDLVQRMKNPVFDGTPVLDDLSAKLAPAGAKPRQLQLMPGLQAGIFSHVKHALLLSKGDVNGAIEQLQGFIQRLNDRYDPDNISLTMRSRVGGMYGVPMGEVTPELVKRYVDDMTAGVQRTIDELKQTPSGAPRKKITVNEAQSLLFGGQQTRAEEDFGAPIPGEEVVDETEETGPIRQLKKPEVSGPPTLEKTEAGAGLTDTQIRKGTKGLELPEHAVGTQEGQTIQQFFQDVKPASESPGETQKHEALRQNAAEALTTYDIVEPGTRSSPALQLVQNILAARFGGMERFQEILGRLKNMSPGEQSALFKYFKLPDLTTRRGMEEFYHDLQVDLEQNLTPEGRIPTQSRPAVALPVSKAALPHTEPQFESQVGEFREYKGTTREGRLPRKPEVIYKRVLHAFSDTKIRPALRLLRQKIEGRLGVTKEDTAAKTYFDRRGTATEALRALAFDLAMYDVDPKGYPANYSYLGEGGEYAKRFRTWVEQNLDPQTVQMLDDMIAEEKATAQALEKYNESVGKWYEQKEKLAEERRKKAQANGVNAPKAPRAPRKKRKIAEARVIKAVDESAFLDEEVAEEIEQARHIPEVYGVHQVHPDMRAALDKGDGKKALEIMASAKGNPYYAALAQRLLDAGVKSKITQIDTGKIEPLDPRDPTILSSFKDQLKVLEGMVRALPAEEQAAALEGLRSNDRDKVFAAISKVSEAPLSETDRQVLGTTAEFATEHFGWDAKYDPATDTITLRKGTVITNATLLHEFVHAGTVEAIRSPEKLRGVRLDGYNQLKELYEYVKQNFADKPDLQGDARPYGFTNLEEFVSEVMTNPDFQALMRQIRYKAFPMSLYNRFMSAVRNLFGISPNRTEESNVLDEALQSTDMMMARPGFGEKGETINVRSKANLQGEQLKGVETSTGALTSEKLEEAEAANQIRLPLGAARRRIPEGRPNTPTAIKNLMKSRSWAEAKRNWPTAYASAKANVRPILLGALTLRQLADLVNKRLPQLDNFIRVVENYMARKNAILKESGNISKRWERLQARDPDMSRTLGKLMHGATLAEVDPDPTSKLSTIADRQKHPELNDLWKEVSKDPEAVRIYRDVRNFYERRYSEYRNTLNKRLIMMRKFGVSEQTITDIRAEFEKARRKGPYFPLMRHGRFWYQVGKGASREYYMFETFGEREHHLEERLKQRPELEDTLLYGDQYKEQQDLHARESQFLKSAFDAIDSSNVLNPQELKDTLYQTWLSNQPETSFRNQFTHRQGVAGYSEDALRNFAKSSFHMAYQMSRFEYASEMFSQLQAAKSQLKDRKDETKRADKATMRENNELSDYLAEADKRLKNILNPDDVGPWLSGLSNIGFLWYLSAPASAITNVLGGMIIGMPTLIGQQVRLNPGMSYARATLNVLGYMKTAAAQIMATGFSVESAGERIRDKTLHFPSLDRSTDLSATDRAAYDRFVADGLIDITATYDQSGLASAPTEQYTGLRNRSMQVLTALFHNAERFNREIIAMSSFRAAMEKRKDYADQKQAFDESIQEAKDLTNRSMFDYSMPNKPRYMQSATARVILQFKQFPQQMTFFLVHNFLNMIKGKSPAERREATARFVGTMGLTGIFAGGTGLFGFSTVASILNAVINGLDDERDEPFDFELEFVNWAVETFGKNAGMFLARGVGNMAGVDLSSRVGLDNMWFRDGRKNTDEAEGLRNFLVELLGPTVGLGIQAAEAVDLWNQGHGDRAIERVLPAALKNLKVAERYATEGVQTKRGDEIVSEVGSFDLLLQSLGLRPAEIAELQYYAITKKGQEQAILKERQNLLNLYGIGFMAGDFDAVETAMEKISKFNSKHPSVAIPFKSIRKSIKERITKSTMTEHGLYVDKRMRGLLDETYVD